MPPKISACLHLDNAEEIRLRANKPVRVKCGGAWFYLGTDGKLKKEDRAALRLDKKEIFDILQASCSHSVYVYERQLVNGFFTLDDGCRIGCAGTVNFKEGRVVSFSEYTSLCVRVARSVVGCSQSIAERIDLRSNILVVGRTGSGKTTFLRDLICQASEKYNVAVVDEKGELTKTRDFDALCGGCDVLLFSDKAFGFRCALRSLSPDIIVCDELITDDFPVVKSAMESGVAVYASLHGADIAAVTERLGRFSLSFDYYVKLCDDVGKTPELYRKSTNQRIL